VHERLRDVLHDFVRDRGSVTAEFAAAVPAVVIVLVCCLAGVQVVGQQVRLQDAAAIVARSVGRGETDAVALGRAQHLAPGSRLAIAATGDLACATLDQPADGPTGVLRITLTARSCALADGG
jgi:Flp pilus assembly protein TadG